MMLYQGILTCLLVTTAVSQGPPAPPYEAPLSAPSGSHSSCSRTTGREWICKIDWWDPYYRTILESKDGQMCGMDDLCYLGPLVSRSLNSPWTRKWMCGPKPCRVEGSEMNSQFEKECPGPEDTCDVGPFPIMVNGSLRLSATFCTHRPVPDNDERSWTDRWTKQLCSVNSTAEGYVALKDCENGELCSRGPVDFWLSGNQYRAFTCTKTPSRMMQPQRSEAQEKLYAIHTALEEMADNLVMSGHVLRKGPHEMIKRLGRKLMEMQSHVEFAEKMARDKGEKGPLKLPDPQMKVLDSIQFDMALLEDKLTFIVGASGAARMYEPLKKACEDFVMSVNGGMEFTIDYAMLFLHKYLQKLMYFVKNDKLDHPLARVVFMNTHGVMMKVKEKLFKEDGNARAMKAFKTMGMSMQKLWNLMSGGPSMPTVTRSSIATRLVDDYKLLQKELFLMKSPEERVKDIWHLIEKLGQLCKEGDMNGEMAKIKYFMIHDRMVALSEFISKLPDNEKAMEIMGEAVVNVQQMWNHMSGGPVYPMSSPELALYGVADALRRLRDHLPSKDQEEDLCPDNDRPGMLEDAKELLSLLMKVKGDKSPSLTDDIDQTRDMPPRDSPDIMSQIGRLQDAMTDLISTQMAPDLMRRNVMEDMGGMAGGDTMGGGMNIPEDWGMDGYMEDDLDMMEDEMDEDQYCSEPFWKKQLSPEEKMKWSPDPEAFMGPADPMPQQ